jgi:hypothetical protein
MPLAIDLYCGLGSWTDGLLAEGWDVIGFDIERHVYGEERYPGMLVVQDVLTIHGSQLRKADLIVSSSPCTKYSYMAMPWSKAKAKAMAAEIRADETGAALRDLNALFDAQFRIQREASEAAGRHIPMIVENVRGAQEWVGPARWNYGSYYLWGGGVPAVMPAVVGGRKNPGFRFDGSGRSFQSESVARHVEGRKLRDEADGYERSHPKAFGWKGPPTSSSATAARKAASAKIAKIPFALSSHIARIYHPMRAAA